MHNLDTIGLILLFGTVIIGGGLYVMSRKQKKVQTVLPSPAEQKEDTTLETAEELTPRIEFPPDVRPEHVPELPWGYSDNKITIMARDPEWIYAYWDISEGKRHSLRHTYGPGWDNSLPVLRIHDVTGITYFNGFNANHHYDIVINDFAGSWYIHVGVPDRTYCVDLGRILKDGTYIVVARSNFTFTPRNNLSDKIDPEWMLVSEHERKLLDRIGQLEGTSSFELFNRQWH